MDQTVIRKRVSKRPADRRQELLAAGLRLFVERGVAQTAVADITDAVGVAKGTFYLYFASKEQLLAALRAWYTAELLDRLAPGLEPDEPTDWWTALDALIASAIDFHLEHYRWHDVVFSHPSAAPSPPAELPSDQDFPVRVVAFLWRGREAGAFGVSDPPTMATLLYSAVHGATDYALRRGPVDRDRLVAACQELARKALTRNAPAKEF